MRKLIRAIVAALFAASIVSGIAYANPHAKHASVKHVTVSGSVLAINGDLVQFREDNGTTITVDQRNLLAAGRPLTLGGHFALHGYFSNHIFIAQVNAVSDTGNGFPYPGSTASVQGIVTAVAGNHVTIMQGLFSTITIDDQKALDNGTVQNLNVGRSITAYGYWSGATFYATSIG
jgi:hypothetical protein